jgi:hypothetical protein
MASRPPQDTRISTKSAVQQADLEVGNVKTKLLLAAGQQEDARHEFERAGELFARKGYRPGESRVVAHLAELSRRPN